MFQGHYIRWNPIPELDGQRMSCEALHDDWEGFRLWFKPQSGPMLIVSFPSVLLHASSEDGSRLSPIINTVPLELPHLFWKVEQSALVAEFHRQSLDTRASWNITHYAFLSVNDCIDVLATEPPVFRQHGGSLP
ncbi:MAG: hypothetical protein ACRCTD_15735 [Beijerinckiaceae bacterium]